MTTAAEQISTNAGAAYVALRHGGAPAERARVQLGLNAAAAKRLERLFQRRAGARGADAMKPRFARHEEHVSAILGQGGYPALQERRR